MDKELFVKTMSRLKDGFDRWYEWSEKIEDVFDYNAAVKCEQYSFLDFLVEVLDALIDPHIADIRYLIYECEWDFEYYNKEYGTNITTWEDFYDFITAQEQKHIKEINLTKESKTWGNASRNSENS